MACRIDLPREIVQQALNTKMASLKRAINTEFNPAIKLLLEKDHNAILLAYNTLTEIK